MMHQCFIKCEACGEEGYIQTKEEPTFCPICGAKNLEIDLIEFELLEAGTKPKPKPKQKKRKTSKNYYKKTGLPRGPKPGQVNIRYDSLYKDHTNPEVLEVIGLEYRQHLDKAGTPGRFRPFLTLNCGYKGVNTYCSVHLHKIHGVPLDEAKEMCNMTTVHKALELKGVTEYKYIRVEMNGTEKESNSPDVFSSNGRHKWLPCEEKGLLQCSICGLGPFTKAQIKRGGFVACKGEKKSATTTN